MGTEYLPNITSIRGRPHHRRPALLILPSANTHAEGRIRRREAGREKGGRVSGGP